MKTFRLLVTFIILAIIANSAIAQTTSINESFETWPAPDWNTYKYEGGGWYHSLAWGANLGYGGGNCALHKIWNSAVNDWLVTPQINVISSNYELVFYEYSSDLQYYTYAGVHISTVSGDPSDGDFVEISESLQVEGEWVAHTIDLSSYNGESIYIAFVFEGSQNNWHQWMVDEVVVAPTDFVDGALTEIVNPMGINPNTSIEDIIVTLHNFGTTVINTADIEWSINGEPQVTYNGTALNINPGAEADITVGQYDFAVQGDYLIALNLVLANDMNPSNDTIESIYYVTDPKDAQLLQITPEGYIPTAGSRDVKAFVSNVGDFTITDLSISWDVNGVSQTDFQISSLNLNPGESTSFTIGQFNFTNGLNEITGTVNVSGDEDLDNNTYIAYASVNALWESFEGVVFPPEMWNADDYSMIENWTSPPAVQGEWYYISATDDNYFGVIKDTIFTPRLQIQSGNTISIWMLNTEPFGNTSNLIWKDGTTGEIHFIQEIVTPPNVWTQVTMDISAAAGNNYIGFAQSSGSYGDRKMDMISSNASVYLFDNDLGIKSFQFDQMAKLDTPHTFNVSLRNYGVNTVLGSNYSVKIMNEMGVQIAEQAGITLNSWEESEFAIPYTYTNMVNENLYAIIEYTADQDDKNNESVHYPLSVVPAEAQTNDIGFAEQTNANIPFNSGGDTWTLGQDDISQGLYFQNEINASGYLYGITLYYDEIMEVGQTLPLQVSITETDLTNLAGGWIPQSELQVVFNDTIQVYAGIHSVYIPFDEPFLVTGNSNLAIQYYQYNPSWPSTACRFYSTNSTGGVVRGIRLSDVYELDPNDLPDYFAEHTDYSYTSFVIVPISENGVISGIVYDENSQPIAGANIQVEGTGMTATTNEDGLYILGNLPYTTYDITASYLGYESSTHSVTINQPEITENFTLQPLPQLIVTGKIFGSNAPDIPLEGATVELDGYSTMSTTTNAAGEFTLENVYGNHEYNLTIHLYGYEDYITTISLEDQNVDLGDIVMQEEFISGYNVFASNMGSDMELIEWLNPLSSQKVKLVNDLNNPSYSFTNEPFENVWLGNRFQNNSQITVTSVEVVWDIYENAHDFATIDILDVNGDLLVSSLPFQTFNDSSMIIDLPNIYIEGDFYAMVHWQNNPASTDPLLIDLSETVPNTAYIKYPDEQPVLLSDFLGSPFGSFFIRVNTLEENMQKQGREVLSYNIFKGLATEIGSAGQWPMLNSEPISDLSFIDETWSSSDPLLYSYAVEAIYTEGNSEFSFSNFVAGFLGVGENETNEVNIFPNPATTTINLEGVDAGKITIYNMIGKVIISENIDSPAKKIDVSSFEAGIYLIRITGLHKEVAKKLIVNK